MKYVGLIAAGMLLAVTASATAATAQLTGNFVITGKVVASNNGLSGQVKTRNYEFTPLCPGAACRRVLLRREGPSHEHYKSTLRRTVGGSFKGTEHTSGRIRCPGDASGTQLVHLRFRITQAEAGRATAISGKAYFDIRCPGPDLFEKARLVGRLRSGAKKVDKLGHDRDCSDFDTWHQAQRFFKRHHPRRDP